MVLTLLLLFSYFEFHIPGFGISARTWMATFFFLFGHAWRENEERGGFLARFDMINGRGQILIIIILAAATQGILCINGPTGMLGFSTKNAPLFMVGALTGSMMMTYICRLIVSRPQSIASQFLIFTGRHTLEVLTWHFSCFKIVSLTLIGLYGLDIERLACFPVIYTRDLQADGVDVSWTLWWVAYTVVGAGVPILWQYVRMKQGKEKRRY